MPAVTPEYAERRTILTFEEITRFVRIAVGLGVNDVRLTGGEPLVRAELHKLISALHSIDGLRKLSLTTNGILLAEQLPALRAAGLQSVNISLDALDEAAFQRVTRRTGLEKVLAGIFACREAGMVVKVNAIAMRDFSEDQIEAFGSFARQTGIPVRFIEFMPLDTDGNWDDERVLTGARIRELFAQFVRPLVPRGEADGAPAVEFTFDDGIGTIGIIASVTEPFCSTCNRFRLTADGQLRNCLFGQDSGDVRQLLRDGSSDEAIADRIKEAVLAKKLGHGTDDLSFLRPTRPMYSIGG